MQPLVRESKEAINAIYCSISQFSMASESMVFAGMFLVVILLLSKVI